MAQKLNEALLRLELEVVGADAIKKAADAVGAYGERTKALQPARVETIIGAVDTATPVLQKAATSHIEYARIVQQSAAMIQTAIKQTLTQEKQYAEALRNLGVPGRLVSGGMREIRPQVREAVRASIGLLPEDMEAIGLSGRLYRQAAMASKALNFADIESQRKANLGTRTVVQLAPVVLGPDITENASYKLLKRAAGRETIGPGDVQKALAELAPLMAQQQLLDIYRAALRLTAAQTLGRPAPVQLERHPLFEENPKISSLLSRPFFFEQQRQGFRQLTKIESELAGRLQASIPLGLLEQPTNPDLEKMALLIASRQQLVAPGLGLASEKRSPLEVAQALRIRSFGPTEAEAPRRKIPKTTDQEIRDTEGEVVGIREGKYLPFIPGPTTLFRPKTKDVREVTAGPMQKPRLPPTAIETTVREVGPITPGQQALISEAEATVSQSREMVPDETVYERFQRINYQKGIQKIQDRIARQKIKSGIPIPSKIEFPEEYPTERLAKEEAEAERLAKEAGGKAPKKPSRPRRRRFFSSNIDELGPVSASIFDLGEDPSRQGFLRGPRIKPSPDISLAQQAQNLLEEYKKSTIFPKTFSKLLNVTPETGETLIKSLQAQGILGQPAGAGLASALPIIKAQIRSLPVTPEPATTVIPVSPIISPPPPYVRTGRPRDVPPEPGTRFIANPSVYPRTPGTGPTVYGPESEPTPKPTPKIEVPRFGGRGSISKQAIDLLEGYEKPTIFPKTFSKLLNIEPSVGQTLIKSLQDQGYLGQAAGPGLASALPIIGAQTRRTQQAKLEIEEAKLGQATAEEAQARRAATRSVQKLAVAQEAAAGGGGGRRGGGGGPVGPEEEEPGKGGRGRPQVGPLGRFGGRFIGLSYYLGAAAILYPILGALSQADQSAKELQTTVQRIQGIYGSHTLSEQLEIKAAIITAAQKYGENLTEVATAAERFAQAQESIKNIGADLETAAAGSRAFGTNMQQIAEFMIGIQETTGGLISGQQAVNLVAAASRGGVVSPMSLMTAGQQLLPITTEQFAPPSGAINDLALINSIVQTVSQRAGLSGTTVANSLRYQFARFGRTETAGEIEQLSGVKLGTLASQGQQLKPLAEILRDLAEAYQHLLDTGQSKKATELLTFLFGPRQIGPGAIFLKEMPEILRKAMEAINDTGALFERVGVQMNTLETAQKRLHNSLTDLWGQGMLPIRTGIDNFIAQLVDAINKVLTLDKSIQEVPDLSGKVLPPKPSQPSGQTTLSEFPDLSGLPPQSLPTQKLKYSGIPMAYGGIPAFLAGSRNIVHEAPAGTIVNESRIPVGKTPDAFVFEEPPIRNIFAEIILKGQVALAAQMQKAQVATIAQQTQTSLQADRMLRQAQGRSTIGLELRGIEAGRVEQRGVNYATFTEQLGLYQGDYARVAKEIADIDANKRFSTAQKKTARRPLEEEQLTLAARMTLLSQQYLQEAKILDIKTEQAKQNAIQLDQMRQQVDKLKELSNIGRIAQDFVTQGLQGVAQALGGGGPGRGGRAAGAFLGAAATGLGAIMSQGLDLFGPQGAFPGVGKALYGKLGRPAEADITAQAQKMAPAIQAKFPGMSLETATELAKSALLKKASKEQALAAIGQVGGSLLGSAVGGNSQGANIGATLGTAAGTLIPGVGPIIGGLVGGLIGGLFGGHRKPPPEIGELKIIAENSGEQVRLLENTNKLLAANFVSFNVPTGFRLPSYQPGSFGGIAASRGAGGNVVNSAIHVNVNIGGTNVGADKLGSTIAQAISDRLELESRSSGAYFPRTLYG